MNILAIETSCDETAAAVVEDGRRILSNVVSTQAAIHARFGGVVAVRVTVHKPHAPIAASFEDVGVSILRARQGG